MSKMSKQTLILGLTGGIASGKSTAVSWFKANDYPVIDLDEIARLVVEPQTPGLAQVINCFGEQYLTGHGTLDRRKLGQTVFSYAHKLEQLNQILQPLILQTFQQQLADLLTKDYKLIVLDVPLLFETNYDRFCDLTLAIGVDQTIQLDRIQARDDCSEKLAWQKIKAQIKAEVRYQLADLVIFNNCTVTEFHAKLSKVIRCIV